MSTIESFVYPYFIQGQQLKSKDLNDILTYVDIQDRLTRAQLTGTGIMSGLEVNWDDSGKKLVVGKGVGISSNGHLFYLPADVSFTHYLNIEASRLTENYFFGDNPATTYNIWKLTEAEEKPKSLTKAEEKPKSLTDFFPIPERCQEEKCNKCVLALRVMKHTNGSEGCFNGLETVSRKVNFEINYYLVDKSLLEKLQPLPTPADPKIDLTTLPVPYLPRLGFESGSLNLSRIVDSPSFKDAFYQVCLSGVDSISFAFNALSASAGDALDPAVQFGPLKANLLASLEQCMEGNGYKLPYFYEFLEDLVKAYLELVSLGVVPLPFAPVEIPEDLFPNHLLLGGFGGFQSKCRTPKYCASICDDPPTDKLEKARCLYRRLDVLWKNTGFNDLPTAVRIIPSKGYDHPLSWRAIPFYYQQVVRPVWNCELTKQGKSQFIPSYLPLPDSGNALYADPLLYELESWGFFRMEGHANMHLQDAIAKIEAERKRLNVSFDIVCVPLSEATRKLMPDTVFDDLESAFHQLRLEWILDLQPRANRLDLMKFLEEIEGKHLHQLNIPRLEQLAAATLQEEDVCKYDVVHHLHETWTKRVASPLFSQFAEHHPGLEHLGGVQPGGTLVLVYDNLMVLPDGPVIGEEKKAASRVVPQVVLADFCLPYLCCTKPQPVAALEIFSCFPQGNLCAGDEPKEIFTWPSSGGRILVSSSNKLIPGAAVIAPTNGRWHFAPSRLPDNVYDQQGTANVLLRFLNSGKTIDVKTVSISRLNAGFQLSAFKVIGSTDQMEKGIQVVVETIVPQSAKTYRWRLVWLKGEDQLGEAITLPDLATNERPWQTPIVKNETPTQVRVELIVINEHGCSARYEQTAFIASPRPTDEIEVIKKNNGNGNNDKPGKPTDKGGKGNSSKQKDKPNQDTESGNPISDTAHLFDVPEVLNRRLNQYKKQFTALRSEGGEPTTWFG